MEGREGTGRGGEGGGNTCMEASLIYRLRLSNGRSLPYPITTSASNCTIDHSFLLHSHPSLSSLTITSSYLQYLPCVTSYTTHSLIRENSPPLPPSPPPPPLSLTTTYFDLIVQGHSSYCSLYRNPLFSLFFGSRSKPRNGYRYNCRKA